MSRLDECECVQRSEAKAPFRLVRLIVTGGLLAGAALGLLIISARLVQALQGGLQAQTQYIQHDRCIGALQAARTAAGHAAVSLCVCPGDCLSAGMSGTSLQPRCGTYKDDAPCWLLCKAAESKA